MTAKIKMIDEIYECPLCGSPVCEAPIGSGDLAFINPNCCYMTHYGWEKEDYIFDEETQAWRGKGEER